MNNEDVEPEMVVKDYWMRAIISNQMANKEES